MATRDASDEEPVGVSHMPGADHTSTARSLSGTCVLTIIGHVATGFTEPEATPIQAQRDPNHSGRVHLDQTYRGGLDGIDGFDYVLLLTYLDLPAPPGSPTDPWKVVPFLLGDTGEHVGTFATRHPNRPNPIGLSLVRLTITHHDGFEFAGVDLVDQTPVLDIKPWVPEFDTPNEPTGTIRTGWYQPSVLDRQGSTPTDLNQKPLSPPHPTEENP